MKQTKLKVAIDFRVEDPRQGIGTALLSLAQGLSRLQQTEQEYLFLVPEHIVGWLAPHIGGACSIVPIPAVPVSLRGRFRASIAGIPGLRKLWLGARKGQALIPRGDGLLARLGCDVVHFPSQAAYLTHVPSIYQPWDLQHCHLPELFSQEDLILRGTYYPAFCEQARFVCVQTEWGKQDLIQQFGLPPEKIIVIRMGSVSEAETPVSESEADAVARQLDLPDEFLVYPAITWPHKNHELILRGLALMKQRTGKTIDVVFTGKPTAQRAALDQLASSLGVASSLHFLGFVSSQQMQVIITRATAMIFPSRFEGLGLPVLEAFRAGLPVLCSSATVLPEVAGEGALFFDPDSPEQMVEAIDSLLKSPELRRRLIARGSDILRHYASDTAAQQFMSLYTATAQRRAS